MNNLIGKKLGQYQILEQVGRGGMAAVFKAYQPGLERHVALKILPPALAGEPGFEERFQREAKAIANLNHPNILPIYDFGQADDYTYIAMRYVEAARTLKEVMAAPLTLAQMADLLGQIAAALDAAHRQGIIHRDVKPGNVLMDGDWALLSDFGLVKLADSSMELTGTGRSIGTPAYMSPEQGRGHAVDHRTDIYALGVILFEMTTGRIPHLADTPFGIIFKRITEPIPSPRTFNPQLPASIEQITLAAMARNPGERFASAGDMAKALKGAVSSLAPDEAFSTMLTGDVTATAPLPGQPLATDRLEAEIQATQPGSSLRVQLPPPPEPARPPEVGRLVGRQTELRYFADKLAQHHLAVISGMAGVGKTALAVTLVQIWQGWRLSDSAPAAQSGPSLPLEQLDSRHTQAQRQLFWHAFHEDEGVLGLIWQLAGFLAWHGQPGLWRMLQSAQLNGGQPPPPTTLFDYAFKLLQGRGYLLCLDDIHYVHADPALPQFIDRLSELVRAGEVSLIITSREVPAYIRSVSFAPLGGMDAAGVGLLAAAQGLSLNQELVDRLYTLTEGNAELLHLALNALKQADRPEQILNSLSESDDIERYLLKEVDEHLSEDDRDILVAVAVLLGFPGIRDAIETVADRRRLKQPLRQLCDKYLLTSQTGDEEEAYNEHAILRTFYYDVPSRRERQAMHRRAGKYYVDEQPDALRAARHFERAGEAEQAAQLAIVDIWRLINQGQAQPLRRLLDRLVEAKLSAGLQILAYLAHGQVCAFLSDNQPARQSYQAALAMLDQQANGDETHRLKARAYRGLGESFQYGSLTEALTWLEQGLAEAIAIENLALRRQEEAVIHVAISIMQWEMGHYPAALSAVEQGLALAPSDALQLQVLALKNLGNIYDDLGQLELARQAWQKGLILCRQIHDTSLELIILSNMGISAATAGLWPEAITHYEHAMQLARQIGNTAQEARIENSLGWLYTNQGHDEAALEHITHSLELSRRYNLTSNLAYILASLGVLHVRLKQWPQAETALQEAEQVALETETNYPLAEIYYSWAQAKLGQAQLLAGEEYAEKALAVARDLGLDFEEGVALGVLGQVKLALGQLEPGLDLLAQSIVHLAKRDPYQAARSQVVWGRYLLSGPDTARGRELLAAAEATFAELGAQRDLAEVRALLGHKTS